jgi:TonB family protein
MLALFALLLAQPVPDPARAPSVLVPPKLLGEAPRAQYPGGRTGPARVVLQLDVDEQGRPQNVAVVTPPQPGFDEAALAAAGSLRFARATQDG